ncbi:MAG TPA: hypothetical protein VEM57_11095 [Candidatus Binatus sp.]|nr:hypothetical protein [Candidatus Binatus sp.]
MSRWALLACLIAAPALADDVEFRLRALDRQAIAGVPVVVELDVVNTTGTEVQTYELTDPAIARIFWVWRTTSGRTREVRMRDYHFSVVPEPAFPAKVTLPPHGEISRVHTVPTPMDFPDGEPWTLAVRVRDPRSQSIATAEVTFEGRVLPEPPVLGKVDPGLAQAALLEYSRDDVLEHGFDARTREAVREASQQREPVARLITVSDRMQSGGDPTPEWDALQAAPPAVRVVRDSLLLDEVSKAAVRRRRIPASRVRLAKRLRPEDPLYGHVRRALRSARPGPR